MPILSFFRIYNVISVHCEPRKGADQQVFEKHTAKQTQHGMCKKKKRKARKQKRQKLQIKKNIYKRNAQIDCYIFSYIFTLFHSSQRFRQLMHRGKNLLHPFRTRMNELLQDIRHQCRSHLLFFCCFFPTHTKNRCEFRSTTGKRKSTDIRKSTRTVEYHIYAPESFEK